MTIQLLLGPNGLMHSSEDENGNVTIFWGGKIYYSFNRNNLFAKKLGIAMLAGLGVLQKTICELFNVSRHTIANIVKFYDEQGIEGLQSYKPGPVSTSEELKQYVIKKYIELEGTRGYQNKILEEVNAKVEEGEFRKSILRGMLQKILREYRAERERQKEENLEKRKKEEIEEEEAGAKDGQMAETGVETNHEEDEKQLDFIEDFVEGEQRCVEHGGAAITAPLLAEYGIADYIPVDEEESRFSNVELAVTYAMLNAGEIAKVEQDLKLLPSYEMGGIIGRVKLPSLSLYRKRIPIITAQMDMRDVILETSKSMHELLCFSDVVYIDGHFMAYHGKSNTLYGYNPQKRLAMHGREYFFVHDRNGLPVYATISDGYRKSKHYIEDVDKKLRYIYGVKKKGLLEVFDRGGYSKKFCVEISDTIRFICWRSDARSLPKGIGIADWAEVKIEHQGNNYGQVDEKTFYAWERKAEFEVEGKKAEFREIWISKGRQTSPALSNDFGASLEDLVRHMTRRWGAQENMFKELKDHGIDRIHSYRKEEFTESFLYKQGLENIEQGISHEIDNPERRDIGKKISGLRAKKNKMSEQILKHQKEGDNKKLLELKRKHTGLEHRINNQIKRRDALPKKVNLFERMQEKGILRLSDEKKLFFDWLKMNAIWAKREIVEIVKPLYKDLRDVNKFVKSILRSRTYVRKEDDLLYVSFPPQRSKKSARALGQLCSTLNEYGDIDLGSNLRRMIFSVQKKY
jgi:transposase